MSSGVRVDLSVAQQIAERLYLRLAPACERIEVAGSVRRGMSTVGDIEFVLIPRMEHDLLGQPVDRPIDDVLAGMVHDVELVAVRGHKRGWKMATYQIPGTPLRLDLFAATPSTWGVELAIRTGPAEYSKALVTQQHFGGLLKDGHHIADGWQLWRIGQPGAIETPEERGFLDSFVEGGWLDPRERGRKVGALLAAVRERYRIRSFEERGQFMDFERRHAAACGKEQDR